MNRIQAAIESLLDQHKLAENYGIWWDTSSELLLQARSECDEIEEALRHNDTTKAATEIGDLVRAALTLCYMEKLDIAEIIEKSNDKFQLRFDTLKTVVEREGLSHLKGIPYKDSLIYWKKAKEQLSQAN